MIKPLKAFALGGLVIVCDYLRLGQRILGDAVDFAVNTVGIDTYMIEDMKATRLKRLRKYYQLSQSQLSRKSGVPLRQIQLFEQRKRDINKTQAETLYNLSQALDCEMKDLLEGNG